MRRATLLLTLALPLALLGPAADPARAQDATVVGNASVIPGTGPGTRTDGKTAGRLMQAASADDAARRKGLKPAAFLASKLIGVEVRGQSGDSVGKIDDLLIVEGGNLKAVVIDVSGFLGIIGGKRIAVEPEALVLRPGGDRFSAVLNMGKDTISAAEPFDPAKALAAQ